MSNVFEDFSGNTPPAEPSGWTKVNFNTWTIPTADDGGGNIIAKDQANGAGSRVHFLVNNAVGSIADASAQTLEVVTKWRFRTGETPGPDLHACLLVQSLDATSLAAYVFGPDSSTQCRAFIRSSTGGTSTLGGVTDVNIGFTLVANTWYWTRFKRETNGIFRGRIWADGDTEPSTWQWESSSANTTLTTGYIGIGGNSSGAEQDFDLVGIGVGEAAPTSAGGGSSDTPITVDYAQAVGEGAGVNLIFSANYVVPVEHAQAVMEGQEIPFLLSQDFADAQAVGEGQAITLLSQLTIVVTDAQAVGEGSSVGGGQTFTLPVTEAQAVGQGGDITLVATGLPSLGNVLVTRRRRRH